MQIVVVERIEDTDEPAYCVHGRTTCLACRKWCWLGSKTIEVVSSGQAQPMCRQCAALEMPGNGVRVGRVDDEQGH